MALGHSENPNWRSSPQRVILIHWRLPPRRSQCQPKQESFISKWMGIKCISATFFFSFDSIRFCYHTGENYERETLESHFHCSVYGIQCGMGGKRHNWCRNVFEGILSKHRRRCLLIHQHRLPDEYRLQPNPLRATNFTDFLIIFNACAIIISLYLERYLVYNNFFRFLPSLPQEKKLMYKQDSVTITKFRCAGRAKFATCISISGLRYRMK